MRNSSASAEPDAGMLDLMAQPVSKQANNAKRCLCPVSTFAEKNGTMINFEGVIQRIRPAVATIEQDRALDGMSMSRLDKFGTKYDKWASGKKIDAKPSWKVITLIANALGYKFKYNMAEDVFKNLSESITEFEEVDYDKIGEMGTQLKSMKTAVK